MIVYFIHTLWWLVVAHVICDLMLQGDLSRLKHPTTQASGMPWQVAMLAHGMIQGSAVWYITGRFELCLLETAAHSTIDYFKCVGRINLEVDQGLHVLCKIVWIAILLWI